MGDSEQSSTEFSTVDNILLSFAGLGALGFVVFGIILLVVYIYTKINDDATAQKLLPIFLFTSFGGLCGLVFFGIVLTVKRECYKNSKIE